MRIDCKILPNKKKTVYIYRHIIQSLDGLAIVLKIFHSFVVHTFVNNVVEISILKKNRKKYRRIRKVSLTRTIVIIIYFAVLLYLLNLFIDILVLLPYCSSHWI